MDIRRKLNYPPYFYICNILISSTTFEKASEEASKIKRYLDNNLNDYEQEVLNKIFSKLNEND